MVLEHQGLPNFQNAGLQPALQLYAAAAAHLAPRNRGGIPPWAPFLQFGVPGVFNSPFLTRPRFGPTPNGSNHSTLAGLTGLTAIGNGNGLSIQHSLNNNRSMQGPPSECSNDDGGELIFLLFFFFYFHRIIIHSKQWLTQNQNRLIRFVCIINDSINLLYKF